MVNPYLARLVAGGVITPEQAQMMDNASSGFDPSIIAGFDPNVIAGDDFDASGELDDADLEALASGEVGFFGPFKKKKKKTTASTGKSPFGALRDLSSAIRERANNPYSQFGIKLPTPAEISQMNQTQLQAQLQQMQAQHQMALLQRQQELQMRQLDAAYGANLTPVPGGAVALGPTGRMRERDLGIESVEPVPVGTGVTIHAQPDGFAFQPHRLICPAPVANAFVITSWTIGGQNQMAGASSLSCASFTPDNVTLRKYDVCPPGNTISMTVLNRYGTGPLHFTGTFVGAHSRNG